MLKYLYQTNDKKKNHELENMINSGIEDLKKEIEEMSEEEKENEKPDKIVEVVREIIKFNKQNQEGKGIKILTPNQMLSRLPISLAQLQAGNNSEKLKNEIRQLLYSLYRSKNMTNPYELKILSVLIKFLCNCFILILILPLILNLILILIIITIIMIMIIIITIIITIIVIIIIIVTIKGTHYKNVDNFYE